MNGWRTFTKLFKRVCRDDSGVSAVEVGITLLPFLLMVFGVAEFGYYFLHQHTMNAAVSEGVRIGSTGAVLTDGGTTLTRQESIKKAILDKANGIIVINPTDIKIFPIDDVTWADPTAPGVVDADNNGGDEGAFMRVRVLYTHHFFTDLVGGFFSSGGTVVMTSQATYRNENFIL